MAIVVPALLLALLVALFFFAERRWPARVDRFEENVLASLLAIITFVSFTQVIARYGFNTGWSGALEFTRILFAWMILFGMGFGIKRSIHLGVDAFVRLLPAGIFRWVAVFGAFATFLYAFLLLYAAWLVLLGIDVSTNWRQTGAIGYWTFMYNLGTGLDDLRYPELLQNLFGLQERVHRWIAYLMLPIGLALLAFRAFEAMIAILRGERELVIAGHEAEELVSEHKDALKD
ncbi:TRAP transporter small permease [Nitratireductor mangrovi]|uniref:TRAP transporter small permease protein n=1 Tax=Nitratireductor mangrovi TaxID=2599600 RepID=A0A5B8KV88_9HYPH|nr:TRAP transporter small permease [Nitratireductor mangrovi]QDY99419.1 TRAP transporter small permease [Nitratireductor mangrovi]